MVIWTTRPSKIFQRAPKTIGPALGTTDDYRTHRSIVLERTSVVGVFIKAEHFKRCVYVSKSGRLYITLQSKFETAIIRDLVLNVNIKRCSAVSKDGLYQLCISIPYGTHRLNSISHFQTVGTSRTRQWSKK